MIATPTVIVLGAGASVPYGFDTGEGLLNRARRIPLESLADLIQPLPRPGAVPLHDALVHTLDSSIDAMLEPRGDIAAPGKALIARLLLTQESEARNRNHHTDRGWYRTLFTALDAPTQAEALAQPVKFVTYNYDRSLEYCLAHAWRVKFSPGQVVNPAAIASMFIHLHGQLGFLPEVGGPGQIVPYGGSADGISEADVLGASRAIQIIHEPHPQDPQFILAREAIAAANRIVFLGFGFSPRNFQRLDLGAHLKPGAAVWACAMGFSPNRMVKLIRGPLEQWTGKVIGQEHQDVYEFLRLYPLALE